MLDQLVESTSHAREDRTKGGLLLTTFVLLVAVLVSSWVYSLFGKELMLSDSELALDTLVASPTRVAVVLDEQDRYQGVLDVGRIGGGLDRPPPS